MQKYTLDFMCDLELFSKIQLHILYVIGKTELSHACAIIHLRKYIHENITCYTTVVYSVSTERSIVYGLSSYSSLT